VARVSTVGAPFLFRARSPRGRSIEMNGRDWLGRRASRSCRVCRALLGRLSRVGRAQGELCDSNGSGQLILDFGFRISLERLSFERIRECLKNFAMG
jgi:hypothetical protein